MAVDHFVTLLDGSIDLGFIDADIATQLGIKSAPIRLRDEGVEPGTEHIERKDRLAKLRQAGYESALSIISDVSVNFNAIYAGKGNSLMLVKRNSKSLISFIELAVSNEATYYDTKSALVARADYLNNKKLLWERAQSNQFLSKSSSAVSSQSSDSNSMTKINLIWAEAHNQVIGKNGVMPWHLPEDLAHFKRMTQGHPVIMGRRTWDSIPAKFRPLPNRTNIVITRQVGWLESQAPSGVQAHPSLEAALEAVSQHSEVWVIGGAQIYAQALPLASTVVVTQIDATFEGDAFAPVLDQNTWIRVNHEVQTAASGLRYAFLTYQRQPIH